MKVFLKFRRLLIGTLLLVLLGWVVLGAVEPPRLLDRSRSSKALYDSGGKLLNLSLSVDEKYRLLTVYEDISPQFVEATLAYEDLYFFYHPGVNPVALLRAALHSLLNPDRPVGGSTITMQLARLRLGLKTRSIFGKAKQVFWALVLERHYSKQQILEAYLNLAPYGANIEGVGAASLIYYRKRATALSQAEAVTLAVLPQHPAVRWRESGRADLEQARVRLIDKLQKEDPDQLIVQREFGFSAADVPAQAQHLFQRLQSLRTETVEYQSTLDSELQRHAEQVLEATLKRFAEYGVNNGAIVVAEVPDLAVRAYLGSANYLGADIDGFVNGLNAPRSPGSLLKPFIYALGIDQGRIIPETMLADIPLRLAAYKPENFERNFLGPIPASAALVRSRNIPALELFRSLAPSSFYSLLVQGGVKRLLPEDYYGIALVLGGLGVTAEEALQLYGVLGNAGEFRQLNFFADTKLQKSTRLLSAEASFLVIDMLSKNPPAFGKFKGTPWKTGTSYGSKDAWAAGLHGKYVILVWLGNFDGKPNANLVGRDFAGPVLFSLVDRLISGGEFASTPSLASLNLKKVEVCALSGALPTANCPHRKESWFIPGVSPISSCTIHQRIEVSSETGLRVCPGEHGEQRVYELWNSDLQKLFSTVGLKRNIPPAYEPKCGLELSSPQKIRIISPEEHIQYYLENHRELELQLLSSTPGDARMVTWFVDDLPVGQVKPTEALYWKAKVGRFLVRAVDDLGRSSSVSVHVQPRVG